MSMITIELDNGFGDELVFAVKDGCRIRFGENVLVAPGKLFLGFELDASVVTSVSGLFVALVALCVDIHKWSHQRKIAAVWDMDRLTEILETELLENDVAQFSLIKVTNFEALTKSEVIPCEVTVRDTIEDKTYSFHIFNDGDIYRIESGTKV